MIEEKQKNCPSFLQDIQQDISYSHVEEHVIRNVKRKQIKKKTLNYEEMKIETLKKRIKEEVKTLFFIVHDEAHFAPLKNSLLDQFLNNPIVTESRNVILLQVSATPYCLVTKNSRIPEKNILKG